MGQKVPPAHDLLYVARCRIVPHHVSLLALYTEGYEGNGGKVWDLSKPVFVVPSDRYNKEKHIHPMVEWEKLDMHIDR
ncbi:hypothetical protein KIPB_000920 [Kipferlia bialata]|uniref:Uncharacterized protein n=1 Tax=Kipferlia bialata TaxID=797122 RepID=A0A391NIF7_9EUKA|nr:hypothetical protein KIPB_000920 [Kipferlia bialata]|eukprot:g920.t1